MAEFLGRNSMFAPAAAADSAYEEGSPQTPSP
jgi:hypothetical protein